MSRDVIPIDGPVDAERPASGPTQAAGPLPRLLDRLRGTLLTTDELADLLKVGVPRDKLFPLRQEPTPPPPAPKRGKTAARSRSTNGKHT